MNLPAGKLAALAKFCASVHLVPEPGVPDVLTLACDGQSVVGWKTTCASSKFEVLAEIGRLAGEVRSLAPNTSAFVPLLDLLARVDVEEGDGFVEIVVDDEGLYGGDGPEAKTLRRFGALIDQVKFCASSEDAFRFRTPKISILAIAHKTARVTLVIGDHADGLSLHVNSVGVPDLRRIARAMLLAADRADTLQAEAAPEVAA